MQALASRSLFSKFVHLRYLVRFRVRRGEILAELQIHKRLSNIVHQIRWKIKIEREREATGTTKLSFFFYSSFTCPTFPLVFLIPLSFLSLTRENMRFLLLFAAVFAFLATVSHASLQDEIDAALKKYCGGKHTLAENLLPCFHRRWSFHAGIKVTAPSTNQKFTNAKKVTVTVSKWLKSVELVRAFWLHDILFVCNCQPANPMPLPRLSTALMYVFNLEILRYREISFCWPKQTHTHK